MKETTTEGAERTAHTPGPWFLQHSGKHDGNRAVRAWRRGRDICAMNGGANDDPEIYANARLIAAAPEMLQALESVLASVPFASYRGDEELDECEEKVRAAIRRARP